MTVDMIFLVNKGRNFNLWLSFLCVGYCTQEEFTQEILGGPFEHAFHLPKQVNFTSFDC